jgi:MFS family permease
MSATTIINRHGNLIAAITALACCNIALGLIVPLVPLVMEAEGDSARLIGINMGLGQFGVFLMGLSLPRLAQKFHGKTIVVISILVMLACMFAFSQTKPVWAWFAIRFMTGLCIASLFTVSETWIQAATTPQNRGRVLGIYMSVLTVTFGIGPFFISWFGTEGYAPWIFCGTCMAVGLIVSSLVTPSENAKGETASGFLKPLARAPMIFLCIAMTTLFEAIMLSFFTIYAIRNGMTLSAASQLLGFGIMACILFFYPTGQLADRWSRGGTVLICATLAVAGCLLLPATISTWWIWPVTLLIRVGAFGVYGVGLAAIGDVFKGSELVAASALVAIGWGVGGFVGPPVAGAIIDAFGIATLPAMMALCYILVLVGMLAYRGKMDRPLRAMAAP